MKSASRLLPTHGVGLRAFHEQRATQLVAATSPPVLRARHGRATAAEAAWIMGFKDFVLDQLTDLRGITCRAMFGGYGLSCGKKFFGIVHKDRLYFKVTPGTAEAYKQQGMNPFRPTSKMTLKTYYEVPPDVIEDPELLVQWAKTALACVAP